MMHHFDYAEQAAELGIGVIVEFICGCGENHNERLDKIVFYNDEQWMLACLFENFEHRISMLESMIYGQNSNDTEGDMDGDED
jgi:hypothetical protein